MPEEVWGVYVYRTREGRMPYREWLKGLRDRFGAARVRSRVDRLRLGILGDWKGVGAGVRELRVDSGPGYRVYFGQTGEGAIILLCGGDKHSQAKDIERAQGFWKDYEKRRAVA